VQKNKERFSTHNRDSSFSTAFKRARALLKLGVHRLYEIIIIVLFFLILINIIFKYALEHSEEVRQKKHIKKLIHMIDNNQGGMLSCLTNLTNEQLFLTPNHYSKVLIPKKTGGQRTLRIPNPELKEVQNSLKAFIENNFQDRIHFTCHSYRKNKSIISNAYPHLENEVLIKLDIKDYFQNITQVQIKDALHLGNKSYISHPAYEDFCQYIPEKLEQASDYLDFPDNYDAIMRLVHTDNGLPQGAPTSPVISNLILSKFDHEMFMVVKSMDGKYSRYSDDLTISFKTDESNKIKRVIKFTESKLAEYGFQLNKKKGKIHVLRKHQAQRICGITINSGKPTISRQHRRLIRAAKHNLKQGKEIQFSDNQLIGHDAFIQMVMGKNI
jgi:RNA-directed DNA polymerase